MTTMLELSAGFLKENVPVGGGKGRVLRRIEGFSEVCG